MNYRTPTPRNPELDSVLSRSVSETAQYAYTICLSDPSPAMTSTKIPFTGTFIEACNEARRLFKEHGRSVLVRGSSPSSYYFRINYKGEEENRNTVPCK